jgi:hypothetical protein
MPDHVILARLTPPAPAHSVIMARPAADRAEAAVITLTFGDRAPCPDQDQVLDGGFRDGGTSSTGASGPNPGVSFGGNAILACRNNPAVRSGNASRRGALAFDDTGPAYPKIPPGSPRGCPSTM